MTVLRHLVSYLACHSDIAVSLKWTGRTWNPSGWSRLRKVTSSPGFWTYCIEMSYTFFNSSASPLKTKLFFPSHQHESSQRRSCPWTSKRMDKGGAPQAPGSFSRMK